LFAVVLDDLGQTNRSSFVSVRIFIPELILPTITITNGPRSFSTVTISPITLQGTASDNIGLDHVEFQVSSGPFLSVTGLVVKADGATDWSAEIPLAPGNNAVRIRSVDLANNKSSDVLLLLTYSATSPLELHKIGDGNIRSGPEWPQITFGENLHCSGQAGLWPNLFRVVRRHADK